MDLKGKNKMRVGDILVLLVYLDSDLGFNKSLNDNMTEWANIYIFYFISQFIAANLVWWFEVTKLRNVVNKQTNNGAVLCWGSILYGISSFPRRPATCTAGWRAAEPVSFFNVAAVALETAAKNSLSPKKKDLIRN